MKYVMAVSPESFDINSKKLEEVFLHKIVHLPFF